MTSTKISILSTANWNSSSAAAPASNTEICDFAERIIRAPSVMISATRKEYTQT